MSNSDSSSLDAKTIAYCEKHVGDDSCKCFNLLNSEINNYNKLYSDWKTKADALNAQYEIDLKAYQDKVTAKRKELTDWVQTYGAKSTDNYPSQYFDDNYVVTMDYHFWHGWTDWTYKWSDKYINQQIANLGPEPTKPTILPQPTFNPTIQCCINSITGNNMTDIVQQCKQKIFNDIINEGNGKGNGNGNGKGNGKGNKDNGKGSNSDNNTRNDVVNKSTNKKNIIIGIVIGLIVLLCLGIIGWILYENLKTPPKSTSKYHRPLTAAKPIQRQPLTAAKPIQRQPLTAAKPIQRQPLTAVKPIQSRPLTAVKPIQSQPLTAVKPIQRQPLTAANTIQRQPLTAVKQIPKSTV